MNKRAKFSLFLLALGLVFEFSPARSQSTDQTQGITRPRTVTTQGARQGTVPTQNPAVPAQSVAQPPLSSQLPAEMAAIQQARPLSMNKISARLAEAKRLLKSRPALTALTSPSLYTVTLAAFDDKSSQIHLISIPKEIFLKKGSELSLTTSLGASVQVRVIRANGVNTAVTVFDSTGRSFVPLIVEYPIERGGVLNETAYYVSAHPALLSPDVVKAGQNYVRTMIDLAAKRLKDKGVPIPSNLVDIAERLCIVEHTDHTRFRNEDRKALFEEIFSLYALNELDTYRHSVSVAGAGGMVQMIPSTYQMVRRMHPGVGLNPDFVYGMRNHGNALEAMLLYMLDTWKLLAGNSDVSGALASGVATWPELMAAGYNSNPAKLPQYIRRGGSGWRVLIPRETQMYLQIYRALEGAIPMKTRS
ncbi:MAG TPA: hypothetical protein VJT09_00230 [Pyrinomonadaceae bacterium]|nr:hypothetical protein [Pyrinomonadaceae bacterium]